MCIHLLEREEEEEEGEHLLHLFTSFPPGARGLIHSHRGAFRRRQDKIRLASVRELLLQAELSMLGDSHRLP